VKGGLSGRPFYLEVGDTTAGTGARRIPMCRAARSRPDPCAKAATQGNEASTGIFAAKPAGERNSNAVFAQTSILSFDRISPGWASPLGCSGPTVGEGTGTSKALYEQGTQGIEGAAPPRPATTARHSRHSRDEGAAPPQPATTTGLSLRQPKPPLGSRWAQPCPVGRRATQGSVGPQGACRAAANSEPGRARCEACGQSRGRLPNSIERSRTARAALVARLSKGSRGRGTTDQSANPMPFPPIPEGDIILWCPDLRTLSETRPLGRAEIQFSTRQF
jgi:hypothetical protein